MQALHGDSTNPSGRAGRRRLALGGLAIATILLGLDVASRELRDRHADLLSRLRLPLGASLEDRQLTRSWLASDARATLRLGDGETFEFRQRIAPVFGAAAEVETSLQPPAGDAIVATSSVGLSGDVETIVAAGSYRFGETEVRWEEVRLQTGERGRRGELQAVELQLRQAEATASLRDLQASWRRSLRDGGASDWRGELAFTGGSIGDRAFESGHLLVVAERVREDALQTFAQPTRGSGPIDLLRRAIASLPLLLPASPELRIESAWLEVDGQRVDGKLQARFDGEGFDDPSSYGETRMAALFTRTALVLDLSLPAALADREIRSWPLLGRLGASAETFVERGWLRREDERVALTMGLEGGQPTLNGGSMRDLLFAIYAKR